jgi:hypothetical protein
MDASEAKRPWWQWLLLYPAVAIALLTAAPQWLDRGLAVWHGTRSSSFAEAEHQSALWRKNLSCSAAPFNWYRNPRNTRVDARICESGDVFVRVSAPDGQTAFQWVDVDAIVAPPGGGFSLIPAAHAATIRTLAGPARMVRQAGGGDPTRVICQGFLDRRQLRRRIQARGACFDEVIDTLTGSVVGRTRVACRPTC